MVRRTRALLFALLATLLIGGLAAPTAGAAAKKKPPKLELPTELRGTVSYQVDSWTEGMTLRETIDTTDLVFKKAKDDEDEAVYELQSGTHHFTALHTAGSCQITADQTFAAAPGSATLTVKKTLITRGNIAYGWTAENTPQALVRHRLPCEDQPGRDETGAPAPWWINALPGFSGNNIYQPWDQAFTGNLTAPVTNGVFRVSWILKGSPLSFDPGDGFTQAEKNKMKAYAGVKKRHARQWKTAEIGCGIAGLAGGGGGAAACALLASGMETLLDSQSETIGDLADDPPRTDFTVVSKPVVEKVPRFKARSSKYRNSATAVNAYLANLAKEDALQRAILTALERSQGADAANASLWWHRQVAAMHRYSAELAGALDRQATLGTKARAGLRKARMRGPGTAAALATMTDRTSRGPFTAVFEHLGDVALPPAPAS